MNKNLLGKFIHLKKLCSEFYHFQMLAVDQRPPIFKIISAAKKRKHSYKEVVECKNLISSNLSPLTSATLLDPHYSIPNILKHNKSKGLIITLEDHEFRETKKGRYSKNIKNWTVEKIKKVGGDAVKVLAWYRPDSEKKSLVHQKKYIQKIGDECETFVDQAKDHFGGEDADQRCACCGRLVGRGLSHAHQTLSLLENQGVTFSPNRKWMLLSE